MVRIELMLGTLLHTDSKVTNITRLPGMEQVPMIVSEFTMVEMKCSV